MSTLHIVNKSPFTHSTLRSCITVCANTDILLFIEDGVYGVIQGHADTAALTSLLEGGVKIYALENDINARAIEKKVIPGIQMINYDNFVKLSLECLRTQSWY